MKIIATILVYNCGDILLNTLKSIDGKVDEIHCYDTCWLPKPKTLHSSDDTKEVIETFSKTSKTKADYTELPSPMSEQRARDSYLERIAEGDWVFSIDSDEVVTNWNDSVRQVLENTSEKGFFWIMDGTRFRVCRLFKKEKGMKYFVHRIASNNVLLDNLQTIDIQVHHDFNKQRREQHASLTAQRPHP